MASFVLAAVPAIVSPPLPFCVCVFFLCGCLSGPCTRFWPAVDPVKIAVDEAACLGGGRVGERDRRGGSVDTEARSVTCLPQVSLNCDGSLFVELSPRFGRPRPCSITAGS